MESLPTTDENQSFSYPDWTPPSTSVGEDIVQNVQLNVNTAPVVGAFNWMQKQMNNMKANWKRVKKEWIVWYRTISRNINMILLLAKQTAGIMILQQIMQIVSLGVVVTSLTIRAATAFGESFGNPWQFIKGMFLLSQAALLIAVQQKAMAAQASMQRGQENIERIMGIASSM